MADHALLSPSSAHRWLKCTRSARLEEKFPDTTSEAAREGTLAHSIAELILKFSLKWITKEQYQVELLAYKQHELYQDEMIEHCRNYTAYVLAKYNEALEESPGALMFIEERVDMSAYAPEMFGTVDNLIVYPGIIIDNDFKYGKRPVDAKDNAQLKCYALGIYERYGWIYEVHTIKLNIFQPRLDNISEWSISVDELLRWAETELTPKGKLAFAGEGTFEAGEHCFFCRAKATCKAHRDYQLGIIPENFELPELLSDRQIADIIHRSSMFVSWVQSVKEYALAEALKGRKFEGLVLTNGKADRVYKDPKAIEDILLRKGYARAQIIEEKLIGVGKMEKLLTKTGFAKLIGKYVLKPKGKAVLDLDTSGRLPYKPGVDAKNEFSQFIQDDDNDFLN